MAWTNAATDFLIEEESVRRILTGENDEIFMAIRICYWDLINYHGSHRFGAIYGGARKVMGQV